MQGGDGFTYYSSLWRKIKGHGGEDLTTEVNPYVWYCAQDFIWELGSLGLGEFSLVVSPSSTDFLPSVLVEISRQVNLHNSISIWLVFAG